MSPCPECLLLFLTCAPLPSQSSCLVQPSPSTLPWWEQFPVGNMQTPKIHHLIGCLLTHSLTCLKPVQRYSLMFTQRLQRSCWAWNQPSTQSSLSHSIVKPNRKCKKCVLYLFMIEGAYVICDMHARSPIPQLHAEQNLLKRNVFCCQEGDFKKERSVTDFLFIHNFLHSEWSYKISNLTLSYCCFH